MLEPPTNINKTKGPFIKRPIHTRKVNHSINASSNFGQGNLLLPTK